METQLSLLEDPPTQGAVPVWDTLDEQQKRDVVSRLAQLIANAVVHLEEHHEPTR